MPSTATLPAAAVANDRICGASTLHSVHGPAQMLITSGPRSFARSTFGPLPRHGNVYEGSPAATVPVPAATGQSGKWAAAMSDARCGVELLCLAVARFTSNATTTRTTTPSAVNHARRLMPLTTAYRPGRSSLACARSPHRSDRCRTTGTTGPARTHRTRAYGRNTPDV